MKSQLFQRKTSPADIRSDEQGFGLIPLIVTLVVFSLLIGTMVTMTSTSQLQIVSSNHSLNAWNLAESGYRFTASYYRNTQDGDKTATSNGNHDDDKALALESDLDGKTYAISSKGSFQLKIMPYWLINKQGTGTVNQITSAMQVKFPGQVPTGFSLPAAGKLKFGDDAGAGVVNYTGGSVSGGVLSASLSQTIGILPGDSVYLVLNPNAPQSLSSGGNLTVSAPNAALFPSRAGLVQIGTGTDLYCYKKCSYNSGSSTFTLENMRRLKVDSTVAGDTTVFTCTSDAFSLSVNTGTNVVLKKFIKFQSTGRTGLEERTLSFYNSLTDSLKDPPPDTVSIQTTADLTSKFYTGGVPNFSVQTLYTSGGGSSIFATMNTLTEFSGTAGSGINNYKFGTFWYCDGVNCVNSRDKVDNYWGVNKGKYKLNYDVQVKVATGKYLQDGALGLSIRGQNSSPDHYPERFLGVSFMQYHLPTIYFDHSSIELTPGDQIRAVIGHHHDVIATGIVQGTPYLTDGSYAHGDAHGTIRLAEWNGIDFEKNEDIQKNISGTWTDVAQVRNHDYAFTGDQNDFIPENIKPKPSDFSAGHPFYAQRYSIGPLLLVFWEKKADGTWRWLAFKDLTHDTHVRGLQDWNDSGVSPYGTCTGSCHQYDGQIVNDNASLVVRVTEDRGTFTIGGNPTTVKHNDIMVFYGDDSSRYSHGTGNGIAYDIMNLRRRYRIGGSEFPTWPPKRLSYWTSDVDYFSHIEEPTGVSQPEQFQWDQLNPQVTDIDLFQILPDGTIRLSEMTTPDCVYPTVCTDSYRQNEIGMHSLGNAATSPYATLGFSDFSLRFYFSGYRQGGFIASGDMAWE